MPINFTPLLSRCISTPASGVGVVGKDSGMAGMAADIERASSFQATLQYAHQAPLLVDRDHIAPLHRHDHADLITLPLLDAPVSRESPY